MIKLTKAKISTS